VTAPPEPSGTRVRRILYLIDSYWHPHGGTEGQLRALIEHLPAPWEAELWVTHHSPWLLENPFPCPHRSLELGSLRSPRTLWRLRRLAREVRARGFDLIQTYMGDSGLVGPLIGRRAGVPVLVSRRDLGFWHTPRMVSAIRRVDRLAAGFVANAEAVRDHVVEVEHVPKSDVAVVHNGHAASGFDAPRTEGLRAAHGIADAAVVLALLANLKPLKRQPDLVEALARLVARHPNVHALFLGQGPDDDIRATASRLGVGDRVTIHHAQGGAVAFVKECAVGVLCSETEGLSNAILEYMACGLPVVATRVGGTPDLVSEGENGFLYAPGDVEALTRHLDRLLAEPALSQRLGRASRVKFERDFGLRRMVEETVAVYERTLRGHAVGLREEAPDPPALAWEVVEDLPALEALADAWRPLLSPNQFFLSPDWVVEWLRGTSDDAKPLVLIARDDSRRLAGLLPLARRRRTIEPCGSYDGADHVDVVAAPGLAMAVARGALDRLLELPWRRLSLRHLAEDGALRRAVRERRWRLPYREVLSTVCPYVRAEGTFDDYLKRFSAKHRGNLRRAARGFREDPASSLRRVTAPEDCSKAIAALFDLHARRFDEHPESTVFHGNRLRALHTALAQRLARRGELVLAFLTTDGQNVAGHYGFRFGGKLYHFQGGFDPAAASRSPGTALQMLLLEDEVFGRGLAEYDFLDGSETYKTTFATGVRRLFDLDVYRPTRRGRATCVLGGLARGSRRALAGRLRNRADLREAPA
jgi:glycosyltransferase involved in cell wall biosynthesis/CelD/BcsL family acetyltransferase involved in cellulose biosynthesis